MTQRLQGRVALVTGGSRGFGRATTLRHAAEGADVLIGFRAAEPEARSAAEEAVRLGVRALTMRADMASDGDVADLARWALTAFGRVDILVNNAGIMDVAPFTEQDTATWSAMIGVNVMGSLGLTRALLPAMIERGFGRIITISSQLGHVGGENFAVYSGTKAFHLAFNKSLAREVGRHGITVNCVCPGSIMTDMNRHIYPTPERQARRAAELPLRRMGDPADVAAAVAYLVTDDASFVTGQCLDVNGGATMA